MSKTIEEILVPKPEARLRIYAYSIDDAAHAGQLKVGQTTRNVKQRVAEQLTTANIQNYTVELDESAERDDGTTFTDHEVCAALAKKGCENAALEWMRGTLKEVKTVLTELRTGQRFNLAPQRLKVAVQGIEQGVRRRTASSNMLRATSDERHRWL